MQPNQYSETTPHDNKATTPWTDEKFEEMKRLWAEGFPASQIAKTLGLQTRNQVLGRLGRAGLLRSRYKDQPKKQHTKFAAKPKELNYSPRKPRVYLADAPGYDFTTPPNDLKIPLKQRKNLFELNGHTCRWPVGDPGLNSFFFCGGYTEATYCSAHAARAYCK